MKKRFLPGKVNSVFLTTVLMLMAFVTVFLLWNQCVRAEEPQTEVNFDVEAGVASLMKAQDVEADKWATVKITPEEALYGANIEVLTEEGRLWKEVEEKVGNVAIAVASDYVYVRSDASTASEILGKAYGDSVVTIVGQKSDEEDIWYEIESGGIKGYIRSDLLRTGEELALLIMSGDVDRAYIETPEQWEDVLSKEEEEQLAKEQQAQREAELARMEAERLAALQNSSATEEAKEAASGGDTSLIRQQIVDYAMQFLGNCYINGGTSLSGGTDCSGFTCFIYKDFGYTIDRTPAGQYNNAGRSISYSEIKPGDIICYGNGKCTHVALYIGNGQIIHSANSRKGVVIYEADYDNIMAVKSILD